MNQLYDSSIAEPPVPRPDVTVVAPTRDDDVMAGSSEIVGGRLGRHGYSSWTFWSPLPILVIFAVGGFVLGLVQKLPCTVSNWSDPGRYTHLCYSDIPPLYSLRGFADNVFPYLSQPLPGQEMLEYPVGTGLFAQLANYLTPRSEGALWFFYANAFLLAICLIVAVIATALTVKRRPWDAAMVALAPGTILTATINWDLFAIALTAVAMMLWARRYPAWAGVLFGLATAAKFYPLLILGPLLILCLRAGRMQAFVRCVIGAVIGWVVLNVPFMLANFDGWARFYTFSSERGEDFGSVWLVLTNLHLGISADALNNVALGLFLLLCIGIAAIGLTSPRRARFAQLAFLVVAAFLLTNKVYSPQYVLWLIPLAAMARPRWRDFLIWQAGELIYYAAIWWYLAGFNDADKGLPVGWYCVAIVVHLVATGYFAGMVIRDIYRPDRDPVRTDGFAEDLDDPGGGVLDQAPDRFTVPRRPAPAVAPAAGDPGDVPEPPA